MDLINAQTRQGAAAALSAMDGRLYRHAAAIRADLVDLAAHLAAFALGWLAVGGVVMTFVGLKCSDLKEQLTLELPPKGRKEMS